MLGIVYGVPKGRAHCFEVNGIMRVAHLRHVSESSYTEMEACGTHIMGAVIKFVRASQGHSTPLLREARLAAPADSWEQFQNSMQHV